MKTNGRARWVAQTGIFLALLIVSQAATRPLGNSFVTGSIVNLLLILTVMICGLSSAATLGVIAPIFAKLLGMGSLWPFIPVIIAGNIVLVLLWDIIAIRRGESGKVFEIAALFAAAAAKFAVLYAGVVQLIVPIVLGLPEQQANTVSAAYSWPQLITAMIGGLLAMLIFRTVRKALSAI